MDAKKTPRADLENKKGLFTEIGLMTALVLSLAVFEWSTTAAEINTKGLTEPIDFDDPEMVPITRTEAPTPPPPPAPKLPDLIVVVDDGTELEDGIEWSSETTIDDVVEYTTIEVKSTEGEDEDDPFVVVEEMPVFPGGDKALRNFLNTEVRYPQIAIESCIQGRVFVSFVIDKDGKVTNAKIARGVDPVLDREALRVVESMPRWTPGMQRGRAVKVSYTVPITFVLK